MSQENTPQQTPVEQAPETFQAPVPDSKRTALLRYMIIMFAVAFVLVLMSMVLQTKSSNSTISELHQSSTSALTKAKQLQDTNRDLQDQIKELNQELTAANDRTAVARAETAAAKEALEALNKEMTTVKAQLDTAWKNNSALTQEKENQKAAYAALAVVLMGHGEEGNAEYAAALDTLEKMKQHLDPAVVSLYDAWLQMDANISE